MNIVCIYRASCFSPNMEDSDTAIMNAVASRVQQAGHMVSCVHEEQLTLSDMKAADVVLSRADATADADNLRLHAEP